MRSNAAVNAMRKPCLQGLPGTVQTGIYRYILCTDWYIPVYTSIYSDILLCAGFRGAHRDAMMPEPSTAPEPEGWDPEEEDHSPCGPQDHGHEEFSAGPDAASMEGAISKFMEGPEGQEHSGFSQIHRLLSCLPVPVQKRKDVATSSELS